MIPPKSVQVETPAVWWMEGHLPLLWNILRQYIIMHWQERSAGSRAQESVYYCRLHHCFLQLTLGDIQAREVDEHPCWECWRAAERYEKVLMEHRTLEASRRQASKGDPA